MDVFLVGGAVRDTLLGLPVTERDWVVVGATTEQMHALGYRQVGHDFPVFLHPQTREEYALARRERKSGHGYHGFSIESDTAVSLHEDLSRRDLSINAMAMDADGCLIDPWGGARDLKDRVLRHVSAAFTEDPLRVLRVARFMARFARLGFRVHPQTLELMQEIVASGELEHLVAERIWSEIQRALTEPSPQEFVRTLRDCGALAVVLPEADALFGVPQPAQHHPEIDTGEHVLLALRIAARLGLSGPARFAVLVHDIGKALTPPDLWPSHIGHERLGAVALRALCARLRVPKAWRELAILVCLHHARCHRAPEMRAAALVRLLEDLDALRQKERFEEFLTACEADARGRIGFEECEYTSAGRLRRAREAAIGVSAAEALARGLRGEQIARDLHRRRCRAVALALGETGKDCGSQ